MRFWIASVAGALLMVGCGTGSANPCAVTSGSTTTAVVSSAGSPTASIAVPPTPPLGTPVTPMATPAGDAAETVPPPDGSCAREPGLKSLNDKTPVKVEFDNRTGVALQLFWLNFSGHRVFYALIPAGHSYIQRTWFTHAWIVADAGKCLYLFVANPYRSVVTVGDGPLVTGPPSTAAPSTPTPATTASTTAVPATAAASGSPEAAGCVFPPSSPTGGVGSSVIAVPAPYDKIPALLTLKYSGPGQFAVQTLSADNNGQEQLVSTAGAYSGVEAVDFLGDQAAAHLKITASAGNWTVYFSDPRTAPAFSTSTSGTNDAVLAYTGGSGDVAITDAGSADFQFAVAQYVALPPSQPSGLAHGSGSYNGTSTIDAGGYLVITSDGTWTIAVSSS